VAAKVAELGFAALLFDFTPLGRLSEQVAELKTVVAYCRGNISSRVILFGRSMGGSAALAVAAADRMIEGLCLWSTPHDLRETFRLSLGDKYEYLAVGAAIAIADEFGTLNLTPNYIRDFDRFDLLACAGRLAGRPLLVVHGENDEIVPRVQAGAIFAAATEPKKMIVIPGGDHRFICGHEQSVRRRAGLAGRCFPQAT
jgi:putative redox protein